MFRQLAPFVLLFAPMTLVAQSPKAVVGDNVVVSAGGEFSLFSPDYTCSSNLPFGCGKRQALGLAGFVDLHVTPRWGGEGEARWLHWNQESVQIESNYLVGPRYRVVRYDRLSGWVKLLVGAGLITTSYYPQAGSVKGSYFVYAPGGTLEYQLNRRLSLRADYEFQEWPSFVAGVPGHNHGLTPNGMSFGMSYKF